MGLTEVENKQSRIGTLKQVYIYICIESKYTWMLKETWFSIPHLRKKKAVYFMTFKVAIIMTYTLGKLL